MAERAPSPPTARRTHGGRDVRGVARGRGEGRQAGREGGGRQTQGPPPLPCLPAPPRARGLGLPRSVPGAGRGGREGRGERRAALCNRRAGAWAARAGGRRGHGDRARARPRGAAGARQVCACPGHRPSPHLCVCLSVCLVCASVSVTWGLRCRHNTGPPGRGGESEAVPRRCASAEGSLQGNGLQGEERGSPSPGAAVPSGTLPAL